MAAPADGIALGAEEPTFSRSVWQMAMRASPRLSLRASAPLLEIPDGEKVVRALRFPVAAGANGAAPSLSEEAIRLAPVELVARAARSFLHRFMDGAQPGALD